VIPERALSWKPKEYAEATLYAAIDFLTPQREWERMDVWVPKEPADGKLPCVVAVFGGGYGDKMGGFINDARPLLKRGFVVAAPDYALQTNAPLPLCSWDVGNAIRYLRANADKHRIDPERLGIWGWSAGGWIAQDLCYAGPERIVHAPVKVNNEKISRWFPMLEPRPQFPELSVRVQAVVSDWGAGKLWERREQTPRSWLSADDPPLFTCYNGEYRKDLVNPAMLLRELGIPSSAVYGIEGNTHVPNLRTAVVHEDGQMTTWGESIYEFFDRWLKNIDVATAPEMLPHGGAIAGPTKVRLLTVHSTGSIYYTLDGSAPTSSSPLYATPVIVKPGQTLRAIAVRDGLKPSRITTGAFTLGPQRPLITTTERTFNATLNNPLRIEFAADCGQGAKWFIGGKTGEQYRKFNGQRFNPPRHVSWLGIDEDTGTVTGMPRTAGKFPVIVSCMIPPTGKQKLPKTGDAVLIVVDVSGKDPTSRVQK
jgi:hypothetical protein